MEKYSIIIKGRTNLGVIDMHIGDVLWQVLNLVFLLLAIGFIVSIFRHFKKRNEQLSRIEGKIDRIQKKMS
jgi:NTP pyrophosphatase (non-canonical NTP hydrolase)